MYSETRLLEKKENVNHPCLCKTCHSDAEVLWVCARGFLCCCEDIVDGYKDMVVARGFCRVRVTVEVCFLAKVKSAHPKSL